MLDITTRVYSKLDLLGREGARVGGGLKRGNNEIYTVLVRLSHRMPLQSLFWSPYRVPLNFELSGVSNELVEFSCLS